MITDELAEKALDFIRDEAPNIAVALAQREAVQEYRKVIKAQIMRENADKPIGTQEAIAYSDPRYIAHLDAISAAIKQHEELKWLMAAAEAKISAWQTQSRNSRGGM